MGLVGANRPTTPPIDVNALHAKIGEPTLENDFLTGLLAFPVLTQKHQ
jgi:hypothetical protein